MATAASMSGKRQSVEMAKRIDIRHKKDNKVYGLRAAYSIHGGDLSGDWGGQRLFEW